MSSGKRHRSSDRRPPGRNDNGSYRLFIAVELPTGAVSGLVSWQEEYLSADPCLRITPTGQLHITLVFIGQVGDREKELSFAQMDELQARRPFPVTMDGIIGLPRGRHPRVIAATVDEPAGTLGSIHDELVAGLVEKRVCKKEKRPYLPHVTIARARGRTRLDPAVISPEPVQFTAVRVTLYNSILNSSGAVHKALKSVQLT